MRQKTVTKVESLPKRWLSNAEAQAYLGMGADFFERLRNEAKIHFYEIGRSIFYEKVDIDNLILENRVI